MRNGLRVFALGVFKIRRYGLWVPLDMDSKPAQMAEIFRRE